MRQSAYSLPQRGAATLVVVMVLFIVMALLSAYASRSLLFEQRIASSYSRATLAQDMGEAGIDWAVAMLNGPAIDESCKPADAPTGQRFVDRYLQVDAADRTTSALVFKDPTSKNEDSFQADCTRTGDGWTCRCPKPDKTRAAPAAVDGEGLVPSFGVRLKLDKSARAGVVTLTGTGCTTSVVDQCGDQLENSGKQQGRARNAAQLALVSAVRSPPAAPLVATGNLNSAGVGIGLHNTDPRTGGMLFVLGGKVTGGLVESRLESIPGTPTNAAHIEEDNALSATDADVFRMFMGMKATRYVDRPGLRVVTCGTGNCKTVLQDAYTRGWRMLWVEGDLELGDGANLGSDVDPVVVVATGAVRLEGPLQLTGMLVSLGGLDWVNATALPSLITGAVLVRGAVATDGSVDVFYQQAVADQLRNRLGSYVRVPGGWTN